MFYYDTRVWELNFAENLYILRIWLINNSLQSIFSDCFSRYTTRECAEIGSHVYPLECNGNVTYLSDWIFPVFEEKEYKDAVEYCQNNNAQIWGDIDGTVEQMQVTIYKKEFLTQSRGFRAAD